MAQPLLVLPLMLGSWVGQHTLQGFYVLQVLPGCAQERGGHNSLILGSVIASPVFHQDEPHYPVIALSAM